MSSDPPKPLTLPRWAVRTLALLLGTCLGLLVLVAVLAWRLSHRVTPFDAELRRAAVREMASSNAGLFDSHPDPDIGRLLSAGMSGFVHLGLRIDTNRFGLREREYEVPKPPGTIRVVLLGDSMIFGMLAAAEDRLGMHLEKWLDERRQTGDEKVEVLHIGVPSWNVRTQAAFLRRQLSLLDPDLVFHVLVPNDIEDDYGVRGFGAAATFSPQRRQRADGRLHSNAPYELHPDARSSLLRLGLDFESKSRYAALRGEIEALARLLERSKIPYRVLFHYRRLSAIAWDEVGRPLEEALGIETIYTSIAFGLDPSLAAAQNDPHWNRRGHKLMAHLFYDLIEKDGLLPSLSPTPWQQAHQSFEEIAGEGRRDATKTGKATRMRQRHSAGVSAEIDFEKIDPQGASQVHGGIDAEARLMPFAAMILRGSGAKVRILAEELPRQELDGAHIRVSIDGEQVGDIELGVSTAIDISFPLPAAVKDREFLTLQFEASDFVHTGEDLRECRVLRLRRVAIEA